MNLHFNSFEEVLANELFQAWYYRTHPERAKQWELWLLQNPSYVPLVQDAIFTLKKLQLPEANIAASLIEAKLEQLNRTLDAAPVVPIRKNWLKWWIPAAAILLLLAGLGYWSAYNPKTKLESQYGAIREYQLPDGSKVTLNAHSEITLHKSWKEGKDREVWLQGEAFFKVQKTPAHNRFIVHTSNMDVIVTGTQFNVISREEESSILLTEGSVTVRTPDGKEVHMKPGDFVRIENNTPSLQQAEQERVLAWKQAKLDFENTSMSEVARIIARHYGVKVSLGDKNLADKKITAVMPNDNLDVLIQALEATGDYKVTRTSEEIIISGTE